MAVFYTSDTHFSHAKILEYGRAGFRDVNDMDEQLIKNWNAVVQDGDEVWHLGDFCLGQKQRAPEYFEALNGQKHLVLGNHDSDDIVKLFVNAGGTFGGELHTLRGHKKNGIVLCHYPIEIWRNMQYGAWHLHGHSHSGCNTRPNAKRLDVGVDSAFKLLGCYRPFSHDEVKQIMSTRHEVNGSDHHKEK